MVAAPDAVAVRENEPPVAFQVTPWFSKSLPTDAVTASVWPIVRPAGFGDTFTLMLDWARVLTAARKNRAGAKKRRFERLWRRRDSEFPFSQNATLNFRKDSIIQCSFCALKPSSQISGDGDLRRKAFIKPLVGNGRAGEVEFFPSGSDLALPGTNQTHVRTVWEYLWHFGSRPKCFSFKQSELILRKYV